MATRTHIVKADFVEPLSIAQPAKCSSKRKAGRKLVKKIAAGSVNKDVPSVETHFAILQLGVSIWNQWRASEPLIRPNLRKANLSGFHLENINFCRVDLAGANLNNAYLYEADFQDADLRHASFRRAGLIGANLHGAIASNANFQNAYLAQSDLSNANFTRALLQKADLQGALVTETVFKKAHIAETELTGSFDLTKAQLESAREIHLACFDASLRAELGLAPNVTVSHETEQAIETEQAVNTKPKGIGFFQPTHKPLSSQPGLRKLAVS